MTRMPIALLFISLTRIQAQDSGGSDIQAGKEIWQGYFKWVWLLWNDAPEGRI